jgi:hypothetical protein
VIGRRGRRRRKLLDDLKERRRYFHLKEEALDRTMWRACFGRGFRPVIRQTTWMNEWWMNLKGKVDIRKPGWQQEELMLPAVHVLANIHSLHFVYFFNICIILYIDERFFIKASYQWTTVVIPVVVRVWQFEKQCAKLIIIIIIIINIKDWILWSVLSPESNCSHQRFFGLPIVLLPCGL